VLPARGFPKPHRRASERIEDLVLASNPAYHPPEDAPPEQDVAGPAGDVCPYPGLAAFRAEDARWFFGRERVTTELVGRVAARLEQARPLVLVGASGSGKSSLLRAGLPADVIRWCAAGAWLPHVAAPAVHPDRRPGW
jgi:ABC-type glutathione transport system ATPase component